MSEIVDRIIDIQIAQRHDARHAYQHDSIMHSEIERARQMLAVVESAMQHEDVPYDSAERVLNEVVSVGLDGWERDRLDRQRMLLLDKAEFPKSFELTVTFPGRFTTSDLPHGVEGCICRPWTRQGGEARFLEPGESVALISGWGRHPDCPNHKPPVIREGEPAYNDLQDYLEGDIRTQNAAAKRMDQRAVTEGQLSPMTYHARWGELPDLKGRP